MSDKGKKKILVVGQTPPPYGGQAMMINRLVSAKFETIEIFHVRMSFSDSFKEISRFKIKKVFTLFRVIMQAIWLRYSKKIKTLYYPPAGPLAIPVVKDIFVLCILRIFFKKTIFHFHAAGVSNFIKKQSAVKRKILYTFYKNPDLGIQLSASTENDAAFFNAKKIAVINYGIEDMLVPEFMPKFDAEAEIRILFVGMISEPKGVDVLLEAARILKVKGYTPRFELMGEYYSQEYRDETEKFIAEHALTNIVSIGERIGEQKWQTFSKTSIMCFPTHFHSESFPNVLLEAMMFNIPVAATNWRGIPDIVDDGETGFLVPVKDPQALADKLEILITDNALRKKMGEAGRKKFLEKYTLEVHLSNMERVLYDAAE